jgi:formylglycine-generating enzyme required for sulfatase activity
MVVTTPSFNLPLLEWIGIPAGSVTLEKGWNGKVYSQEKSESYRVETFMISKYPITYAQFEMFIHDNGYGDDRWWQGLAERITEPQQASWSLVNHPRETVSWYEALAFSRWLSSKLEVIVTLPTEMQWQRAAQSDDNREYPWGRSFDMRRCNTYESGIKQTTPVDRYPSGASLYGVMDMSGNVWEWCLNEYANPGNNNMDGKAARSLRGGSWFNNLENAQVTYRGLFRPVNQDDNIGFRLIR